MCPSGNSYGGYVTGGDFINKGDFRAGESIYGDNFDIEKSVRKHDKTGTMTMYTGASRQANTSHYMITTQDSPDLKQYYPNVFGQVVSGLDVLNAISTSCQWPTKPVIVADCRQIIDGKAYEQNMTLEVFFDIEIGGTLSGRIIIKLFDDTTPITAHNFRARK
ncbi:hypothetical protein AgCh_002285 [Apium graveolens]